MEPTSPAEPGTFDWTSDEIQKQWITDDLRRGTLRLPVVEVQWLDRAHMRREARRMRALWTRIVSVQHERPMVRGRESHRDSAGHRRSSSSSRTSSSDPGDPDGPSSSRRAS